jgi:hypothetical protein
MVVLKPKIKKKLVRALRSGRYRKIRNVMHRGERFCVLGVLCELYRKEHPKAQWIEPEAGDFEFQASPKGESNETHPPEKVWKWALKGKAALIRDDEPHFDFECGRTQYGCLSEANDDGVSFSKLADVIEDHL